MGDLKDDKVCSERDALPGRIDLLEARGGHHDRLRVERWVGCRVGMQGYLHATGLNARIVRERNRHAEVIAFRRVVRVQRDAVTGEGDVTRNLSSHGCNGEQNGNEQQQENQG